MTGQVTLTPVYGDNYKRGYAGFTYTEDSVISCGIVWFTRWERYVAAPVSHVLIVTGEDECIEAVGKGVVRSSLSSYFKDPHVHIFFREPRGFTPEMAEEIVAGAEQCLGQKYGYRLIVAYAIGNSVFGKALGIGPMLCRWADSKREMICSEMAAFALNNAKELRGVGILKRPPREITPQGLAGDDGVFKPMKF